MEELRIEGYTRQEILALPDAELAQIITYDRPVVFRAGSATVLGQVRVDRTTLVIEIAHVDGGGEGVLPALWSLGPGIARRLNLERVEWLVHATRCANPNLALRRVLERRGFTVHELPTIGQLYFHAVELRASGE
jgi:hypothetical protein